jgi:DNA-binding response OmpR family regulator
MKIENEKMVLSDLNEDLKRLMSVSTYKLGAFTFNVGNRILTIGSENVKLTRKESYLFVTFAANINVFLERKFLLTSIWKVDNYSNSRSMDVYICKLRKLLAKDESINIINFHAKGYKLILT